MRFLIVLFYLLSTLPANATLNDVDKTQIFNKNLLKNGGFENGKQYWTPNDTADFTTTTTSPMVGLVNAAWDADASADTLITTAVQIPSGMYGRNAVASCLFSNASGTATVEIQAYDGSNVLSEQTITSSSTPTRASANFIMPSSGSIQLRLYANADEPDVEIDDCYLGPTEGYNIGSVSQAQFVGSIKFGNGCTWAITQSSYAANYTADGSCTTTIEGSGLSLLGATRPGAIINNAKPGRYVAIWSGNLYKSNTSNLNCEYRFYDGTNDWGHGAVFASGIAGGGSTITGDYTVTTPTSAISLDLQAAGSGGAIACEVYGGGLSTNKIMVYYYPTSQDQVYSPDKLANTWQGVYTNTCQWTLTGITTPTLPAGDATCSLTQVVNRNVGTVSSVADGTGNQPAITFTPSTAGEYLVCANAILYSSTTATIQHQLYTSGQVIFDIIMAGSTNARMNMSSCGVLAVSSTTSVQIESRGSLNTGNLTWNANINSAPPLQISITKLSQLVNAPVLVGSVTSSSSGVVRAESGRITCSSSSSIVSQLGNWIASVGNVSAGACVVSFVANTFSAAPYCKMTEISSNPSAVLGINTVSSSSVTTDCDAASSGADCTNNTYDIMCIGAK